MYLLGFYVFCNIDYLNVANKEFKVLTDNRNIYILGVYTYICDVTWRRL